jgi:hypothetical protein
MIDRRLRGPVIDPVADLSQGTFVDARLRKRSLRIAEAMVKAPALPFPESMGSASELEGFYRFVENPRVDPEESLAAHARATCERMRGRALVVVAHDTTEYRFSNESPREGLGPLSRSGTQGFLDHTALAVEPSGRRDVYGVLSSLRYARPRPEGETAQPRRTHRERYHDTDKESQRWWESVEAVETVIATVPEGERPAVVHVMDREADSYELLAALVQQRRRFVVRCCYDRRVDPPTGAPPASKLRTAVATASVVATREGVQVSRRGVNRTKRAVKRYPVRKERVATVQVSAAPVALMRPEVCGESQPPRLSLNVVHVWERNPPDGAEPIEWYLYTSEPITTGEQVLAVVDLYRARWTVEEYFKAMKTGCAFERRQLETLASLLVAHALLVPVACSLLRLRTLADLREVVPASEILTVVQVRILRQKVPKLMSGLTPTVREAMLAIAALGGHLKSNGAPGWQVLGRGYEKLRSLEEGFLCAKAI